MRHVGVRPEGELEEVEDGRYRKTYIERLEDGGYKLWNKKLLNSGCEREIESIEKLNDLIYCPICDEWCNEKQFI